jgi:uncharacterized protein YndB with AHSA1/START domain
MRNNIISFRKLVARRKARQGLHPHADWLGSYFRFWDESLARLQTHVQRLHEEDKAMTTVETVTAPDDLTLDDLRIEPSASEPTVVITRTLKAQRALVWKMVSEPEHLIRWWGPHGYDNTIKQFDFRVGGKWKIESRPRDGRVFTFIGEYLEIVPPERLVQTFGVEGMFDGKYSVDRLTLTEVDGQTIYSVTSRFDTVAERDGMLASGMEHGVRQGFERLDTMLADLQAKS